MLEEVQNEFEGVKIGGRPAVVKLAAKDENEVSIEVEVADKYTTYLKVEVLKDVSRINSKGVRYVSTKSIKETVDEVVELCKKLVG